MLTISESMDLSDLVEEQKKTNELLKKLNDNISNLIIMYATDSKNVCIVPANDEDEVGVYVPKENYRNLAYVCPIEYAYFDRPRGSSL